MQGLQVDHEVPRQAADCAARDANSMVILEVVSDLFTLAVVKEALQADEGHHVVADRAAGKRSWARLSERRVMTPALVAWASATEGGVAIHPLLHT